MSARASLLLAVAACAPHAANLRVPDASKAGNLATARREILMFESSGDATAADVFAPSYVGCGSQCDLRPAALIRAGSCLTSAV